MTEYIGPGARKRVAHQKKNVFLKTNKRNGQRRAGEGKEGRRQPNPALT